MSVKIALLLSNVTHGPPKQLFVYKQTSFFIRGLPLIIYASRGGGGVNTNAYKCIRGGRGGLNMTKNTHLYAGILKVRQYLKHLRIDNSDFCLIRLRFTFWMISL